MSKKRRSPRLPPDTTELIRKRAVYELESQRQKMAEEMAEVAVIAVGITAFDVFDIKGDKLKEFVDKFLLQFDCLAAGTVEIDDLRELLATEAECEFRCVR